MSASPLSRNFDGYVREIEDAYAKFGYTLGWRFLCVSRKVLTNTVDIALIACNPGGDRIPPDHPTGSCEHGCAYLVEKWRGGPRGRAPLQIQVQTLFQALYGMTHLGSSFEDLMERSLIGYFVPFRSRSVSDLPCKEKSFALGKSLWSRILMSTRPRLVVCIDRYTYRELMHILPSSLDVRLCSSQKMATGWGGYSADLHRFNGPVVRVCLLRLPHLSRFTLFTSTKCRIYVEEIIRATCNDL